MTRRPPQALLAFAALAGACAMPPKPRELTALEDLRRHQHAEAAVDRSPRFGKEADRLLRRAREAWEANDLHESRRDAQLGTIRLRTALAIFERGRNETRLTELEREHAEARVEYRRLRGALVAVQEQLALMEQIREERASAKEQRQRSAAQRSIAEAELSLRTADTVDARAHAKDTYSDAAARLQLAKVAYDQGHWPEAIHAAQSAQQQAELAHERARPAYLDAKKTQQDKARDAALARDAAALPGVTVRLEVDEEVTRLVVPLHGLFRRRGRAILPAADPLLDRLADLLQKYSTYPVQVVGHTDGRGRRSALNSLSRARAEATRDALVRRGVDAGRFAASGVGSDEPMADNRSRSGRAKNNRVEIVFLYRR